ncbi:MAG: bifunctional sugar-1-phosphate nucleotidylyltransferase/acetyltransferase [Methermicoccaceae archaeon]
MKAVILAAGRGERLQPLTDNRPKPLLPVCNKPLIDYQLLALKRYGVDEIAVVVGHHEQLLRAHLKGYKCFKDTCTGTASALYAARDFLDEDFLLLYGDVFYDGSLEGVASTEDSMAVCEVGDVSPFGAVRSEKGRLTDIVEKGKSGSGFINAGIYHLSPEILDYIVKTEKSERGEFELTDSLMAYNREKDVSVVPLRGYWNDVGHPWDYLDVNMHVLSRIGLSIGEDSHVWKSATLRKPVLIGDGCTVKNSVVESSVLGDGCTVGEFSIVKRSVIMDNSNAPHLNYVADSVIGQGCNLGAGTKIANLRFDDANVKMKVKDGVVDTGRRKLGAVLGDGVKTGINVCIYPGVKVRSGAHLPTPSAIMRDV